MEDEVASTKDFRGYKKTADGKTTSYFHTEISDEAKKLIGDCKPQKLDPATASDAVLKASSTGASVSNQAGTFEERSFTKWYHEQLRERTPSSIELPNDLPDIAVSIDSVLGDANINASRGKTRWLQDVSLHLKWSFSIDGKNAEGTIKFESDGDGDYDVIVEVDSSKSDASTRQMVTEFVRSTSKGTQPEIMKILRAVEKEFRAMK